MVLSAGIEVVVVVICAGVVVVVIGVVVGELDGDEVGKDDGLDVGDKEGEDGHVNSGGSEETDLLSSQRIYMRILRKSHQNKDMRATVASK